TTCTFSPTFCGPSLLPYPGYGGGGSSIGGSQSGGDSGGGGGSSPDTTPPVISSIASSTAATTATVTWTTDEAASSQVNYGLTNAYGSTTTLNSTLTTSHQVVLSGLTGNTTYHFRVRSTDAQGNLSVSTDQIFTTAVPQSWS